MTSSTFALAALALAACVTTDDPDPVAPAVEVGPTSVPRALDRDIVKNGVDAVTPEVMRCGDALHAVGLVRVEVVVAPSGRVTSAAPRARFDGSVKPGDAPPALADCVAGVMARATFAPTQTGGTFAYPFRFPASRERT